MKDANKTVLAEGDRVTYFLGGRYDDLITGVISEFTPKKVRIRVQRSSRWGAGHPDETVLASPYRVVKVFNQEEDPF